MPSRWETVAYPPVEPKKLLTVSELTLATPANSKVVDGLSFLLNRGEKVGLIGPSGSGKSLTAAAILDLLPPSIHRRQGTITWHEDAQPIALTSKNIRYYRGSQIALIFQEPTSALNPTHRVGRQVAEAVRHLQPHLSAKQVASRTDELLAEVQLAAELTRIKEAYPHELSGGQRQRILIAIALAGNPDLLIADEPTTALDPATEHQLLNLLDQLVNQRNLALLLITHDLAIVEQRTDRQIRLVAGRVSDEVPRTAPDQIDVEVETHYNASAAKMLRISEVDFHYPSKKRWSGPVNKEVAVLNKLNLIIRAGEWVALTGPSGVGKTTLANLLVGQLIPTGGTVNYAGKRPQLIPQDPYTSLNPRHRVQRILREVLRVHEPDNTENGHEQRSLELLTQVSLPHDVLQRFPADLSGGQKQRVAIARALAASPQVLIADESVSALDEQTREEILTLYHQLLNSAGIGLLFITHDLKLCRKYANRTLELRKGQLTPIEF